MNRQRTIAYIEVSLAVLAWGASFVATKIALQELHPTAIVWLRFGIGLLVMGLVVALRRQFALPARKDLIYLALIGFLGITFHQWLQSTALQTTEASTTAWIVAVSPVFIAILGSLALNEKLAPWQIIGIGLAALGVLLVVTRGDLAAIAGGRFGTLGDFLVLASALNWAVFSVLSRRGLKTYPASQMIFYVMGFGWLFSSLLVLAGPDLGQIGPLSRSAWLAIAFLGVVCSGLGYIFWYDALHILPVAQAGAFLYLEPLVTVFVAALLLNEPLLWSSLLGGALILAGVILVQTTRK